MVVDYRDNMLSCFNQLFTEHGTTVHRCSDRLEAMSKLWELVASDIRIRAIISSWRLQDDEARQFYSLIGREVDHTSLNIYRNSLKIDPTQQTFLVCYTHHPEEAVQNLRQARLYQHVAVADMRHVTPEDIVQALVTKDRDGVIDYFHQQIRCNLEQRTPVDKAACYPQPLSGLNKSW